jgi:hypothetical protein
MSTTAVKRVLRYLKVGGLCQSFDTQEDQWRSKNKLHGLIRKISLSSKIPLAPLEIPQTAPLETDIAEEF